jgi:hypothetical protein
MDSGMESQLSFLERPEVNAAVAEMAESGTEFRGAVFTRREVVEFILDLAGYTVDKPLHRARLLEPSMGHGDFLAPVVDRLFEAYNRHTDGRGDIVKELADCIVAVELVWSKIKTVGKTGVILSMANSVNPRINASARAVL